ncbi:MAG: histidine kinase [Bacteroidota bacterium]
MYLPETAQPPAPRLTRRGVGLAALIWVSYTVLYSSLIAREDGQPFVYVLLGQAIWNMVRALGFLPFWWLLVVRLGGVSWPGLAVAHTISAIAYGWLGLRTLLFQVTYTSPESVRNALEGVSQWIFFEGITIYTIQMAIVLGLLSRRRLHWREQQATQLMALARERELAALKAQVNPHFLFNALNAISATISQQPGRARDMIAELAELMRYSLSSSKRHLVPLGDEVDFTRAYLAMEASRFSDRLRVDYDVDPALLDLQVPPMILQPLVENAVKHGIAPSEDGGAITVRVARANGHVHLRVEDTGVGPGHSAPGTGIGLDNTQARLARLYGPAASLTAAPTEPRGYRVDIAIPYAPTSTS